MLSADDIKLILTRHGSAGRMSLADNLHSSCISTLSSAWNTLCDTFKFDAMAAMDVRRATRAFTGLRGSSSRDVRARGPSRTYTVFRENGTNSRQTRRHRVSRDGVSSREMLFGTVRWRVSDTRMSVTGTGNVCEKRVAVYTSDDIILSTVACYHRRGSPGASKYRNAPPTARTRTKSFPTSLKRPSHTINFTDIIIIDIIYITDSVVFKLSFFYADSSSVLTIHDQKYCQ